MICVAAVSLSLSPAHWCLPLKPKPNLRGWAVCKWDLPLPDGVARLFSSTATGLILTDLPLCGCLPVSGWNRRPQGVSSSSVVIRGGSPSASHLHLKKNVFSFTASQGSEHSEPPASRTLSPPLYPLYLIEMYCDMRVCGHVIVVHPITQEGSCPLITAVLCCRSPSLAAGSGYFICTQGGELAVQLEGAQGIHNTSLQTAQQ